MTNWEIWYHVFMILQIRRISLHDSAKANFVEQMIWVFHDSKQFDLQKNRFHTCACTQSNQNRQRKQKSMVEYIEGVKSIDL